MTSKTDLEKLIKEGPWKDLKPHLGRGNLLNVHFSAKFLDVALHVDQDNDEYIRHYMNGNIIHRPNDNQVIKWDTNPEKPFRYITIGQFILIQEVLKKHY
jgi:hypothetical protein